MTGSPNPFVGPRPFEAEERLWGRDREIRELDNLLAAERVVLLHSPSGAGKSSLLQAGLLPRLKATFDVWGPTRLNQEPAAGALGNRYAASAVLGLEEGVPERLRRPPEVLAGLTLRGYAEGRPRRRSAPKSVLLIFDQFEEVLTVDPLATAAKEAFFDQLGELLRDPGVWALLALREDYLAPLDPYAERVPTHLENRFRIDLLGLDGAVEAMVGPVRQAGREFPAAGKLARDLALRKVQQPDGSFLEQVGEHVEPVQLQVVCRRLWAALPEERRVISTEDLAQFGDVNAALSDYYAESVARIAGGDAAIERAIRDWFGEALIWGGIRAQVLHRPEASGGLANELIAQLLDTHLVRSEKRAGATWYELAHDRLIGSVQCDNLGWRDRHLVEAQRRAEAWERQGRPHGLLLAGDELTAAELWAENAPVVTSVERALLAASAEARELAQRERRQAARIRRLGFAALVVGAVAFLAGLFAVWEWRQAERARFAAQTQTLVEQARGLFQDRLDLALLLALEVHRRGDAFAAGRLLYEGLESSPRLAALLAGHGGDVRAVAWSPDGRLLASGGAEPPLLLWDVRDKRFEPAPLPGASGPLWSLAWSREGGLAAAGEGGEVLVWDHPASGEPPRRFASSARAIHAVAFDPVGVRLAAVRSDDLVELWDLASGGNLSPPLAGASDQVRAVAWSPDGRFVAAAGMDKAVRLWEAATGRLLEPALTGHWEGVMSLAWNGDGQLASGSLDGTVGLWHFPPGTPFPERAHRVYPQVGAVAALAWGSRPGELAVAGNNGSLALWNVGEPARLRPLGPTSEGQRAALLSLALSPDGRLASGNGSVIAVWDAGLGPRLGRRLELGLIETRGFAASPDGATLAVAGKHAVTGEPLLHLLDASSLETRRELPSAGPVLLSWGADGASLWAASGDRKLRRLSAREGQILDEWRAEASGRTRWAKLRFSPDGTRLATAGRDGTVELWDTAALRPLAAALGSDSPITALAWSTDGRRLALGDAGGRLWWWDGGARHELTARPEGPGGGEITSLAWSPAGDRLATGGPRGVSLWSVASGELLGELAEAHPRPARLLAWSPDGGTLAAATPERTILLWDVARRELAVGPLLGHTEAITDLLFAPDGTTLLSLDPSGILWSWDLDPASWRQRACALVRRDLTAAERQRYLPDSDPEPLCRRDPATGRWRSVS